MYTISADLVVPEEGAEGVIVAAFDHLGGFSLYVQDEAQAPLLDARRARVHASGRDAAPLGDVSVEMVFAADAPKPATAGEVTLLVNGEPVANGSH